MHQSLDKNYPIWYQKPICVENKILALATSKTRQNLLTSLVRQWQRQTHTTQETCRNWSHHRNFTNTLTTKFSSIIWPSRQISWSLEVAFLSHSILRLSKYEWRHPWVWIYEWRHLWLWIFHFHRWMNDFAINSYRRGFGQLRWQLWARSKCQMKPGKIRYLLHANCCNL